MIKRQKKVAGFTLIEVMAGIVIMAVGLLLLLPMMVTSIKANDVARKSTEASMLLKDKMEDLKNMNPAISGVDTVGTTTRSWTATEISTNLTELTVTINWTDERGNPHSNTMTSYKSAH